MRFSCSRRLSVLVAALAVACSSPKPAPAPVADSPVPPSQFVTPIGQLPQVDLTAVQDHVRMLASDDFEGRAPGSHGEDLTVTYLVDQFKSFGLRPGNTDGTYTQKVPLVGITPEASPLTVKRGNQQATYRYKDDVVAWTKRVSDTAGIENSEIVFVGYGVEAPEYGWDDYKGVDVKGKTLLMLINDPPVPDQADPSKLDPKIFGGRAMTYYGRWTYKFETAAKKGAAGALIVHETEPAGYAFNVVQGNLGEKFDLVTPDKNMGRAAIEGWITNDAGRALVKMGGQDFDALKKQAATREFKPVALGVTASMQLKNRLRTINSRNVIARLDGSDAKVRDEFVVYTAHWDHLGIGAPVDGDRIYNGAEDNAIGVAGLLAIAQAFKKLPTPPRRSVLFLSVTAEEQGLLGSEYYARNPVIPLSKTLANINIDELNPHGRTRDLPVIGLGQSDLDDYVAAAAAEQGRIITGDQEPEKGYYYRSDHFNFAKVGVPALDADPARELEFIGRPPDYGRKVVQDFTEHTYHQPSDDVKPDWDLTGAREDLEVLLAVGYRVAQADRFPEWKPGSEFKAKRDEMLKGRK